MKVSVVHTRIFMKKIPFYSTNNKKKLQRSTIILLSSYFQTDGRNVSIFFSIYTITDLMNSFLIDNGWSQLLISLETIVSQQYDRL